MSYSEFQLKASDGLKLFACEWATESPSGVVCLIHGYGEYSGKYKHVTTALNAAGYAVLALDLRGHGRSEGKRGHTPSYEHMMNDIKMIINEASHRYVNLPCFLYGHSMGGNLVLNYTLRRKPALAGVISTGPWLRLAFEPPRYKVVLGQMMNLLYPSFTQKNGMDAKSLSHDAGEEKETVHDPLLHGDISARLFTGIRRAGLWALEHAAEFPLPLLLMHGGDDRITSTQASREFAGKVKTECTLKIWDGLYHEIHNEPQQQDVIEYMIDWLKGHTLSTNTF